MTRNELLAVLVVLLLIHFIWSPSPRQDALLIPVALLGFGFDVALMQLGIFQFEQFPYWLATLWIAFVFAVRHSLNWLKKLPLYFSSALGAMFGTLSYLAGEQLMAVTFPLGMIPTTIILMLAWALLLPFVIKADETITVVT